MNPRPEARIRVVLADDHALVTEGLRALIDRQPDMEVVQIVQDGQELIHFLERAPAVDVAVIDVQMPSSGLDALAEIRRRDLPVHVLILTAFADGESIQKALHYGAEGFALKTESPNQTIEAIRQVAQGRLVFPRAAQRWMSRSAPASQRRHRAIPARGGGAGKAGRRPHQCRNRRRVDRQRKHGALSSQEHLRKTRRHQPD
jgi:DNA-binding NarL/FixJ family response regulator